MRRSTSSPTSDRSPRSSARRSGRTRRDAPSISSRALARMAEWTKQLRIGQPVQPPPDADVSLFGPLAEEVSGLARTLARTRVVAEQEARLRLSGESIWTEERLKQFVRMQFGDQAIFVVSNREPLSHVRDGKDIRTQQPASGLV